MEKSLPGTLSSSAHKCPADTGSAAWICLVTALRRRPDGLPPTLTINGLPAYVTKQRSRQLCN